MKNITTLCDKIIELRSRSDDDFDFFINDGMRSCDPNSDMVEFLVSRPLSTPLDDKAYADIAIKNAAKLARALKLVIENLETMTDIRLPNETLEKIEGIFK